MMTDTGRHPPPFSPPVSRVLVVDDDPGSRMLLADLLESSGYRTAVAADGKAALASVASSCPDVILLDVMMPEMDGFQVCRQLKGMDETAHVPVLLVTALTDRQSRLNGIGAGADDFLTKPIDRREVELRVRNAVGAKRLFDQVQQDIRRLRELEEVRDNLTHMIVHDLKSPLMGITGNLEVLGMSVTAKLDADELEILADAAASAALLQNMINSLLDVHRMESGAIVLSAAPCDLAVLIEQTVRLIHPANLGPEVLFRFDAGPLTVSCDHTLIARVVTNLVSNALRHTPPDGVIVVGGETLADAVRVTVKDTGPGIEPRYHERIFEKFAQIQPRESGGYRSTGLGLTFCKLAVEAHGGGIGLESAPGCGSTFWFTLPCVARNECTKREDTSQ